MNSVLNLLPTALLRRGLLLALPLCLFLSAPRPATAGGARNDSSSEANVDRSVYDRLSNSVEVDAYTLTNAHGAKAKIITYGATLTELWIPDRTGQVEDVVLGYADLKGYETNNRTWFGATVGRVANRIAGGKMTVDGQDYSLELNEAHDTLHSGSIGLSHVLWNAEPVHEHGAPGVRFSYASKDGEGGFPGTLKVEVTYVLTDANELKIQYSARTDKTTPVNLTNHSYFNLDGSANVLDYRVQLFASHYTPVDANLIPSGEILPVTQTPLDFTQSAVIGTGIGELTLTHGYDHNFVADDSSNKLKHIAHVVAQKNGRTMDVWTTEPAVQFYTGNFLDGTITGKRGVVYGKNAALCLETQHYPDAVHHANFPSILLHPGEHFHSETIYKFSFQ